MKNVFGFVLAALCALMFAACPQDTATAEKYDPIDPKLEGPWALFKSGSVATGDDKRTFNINADGTFTAKLNPGGQGFGEVQGKLVRKGSDYLMINMAGKNAGDPDWVNQSGAMTAGKYCQIEFSGNDVFNYKSIGNALIEQFFGGEYHRVVTPVTP